MNPILHYYTHSDERAELPFQAASYHYTTYRTGSNGWSFISWQFGYGRRIIRVPKYGKEERNSLWTLTHMGRRIPGGTWAFRY